MRNEVRFLLNGEPQRVSARAGNLTLLAWLRQNPHLRGTKQGCAEGDCGACSVAVASLKAPVAGPVDNNGPALNSPAENSLVWRPVNACILFLGMIDGMAVRTVEGLADKAGNLHPVQVAMVTADASQCGFCTPGFVMSLFAAWQNRRGPANGLENALGADEVDNTLAGNLCRCTGYRPIVAAAQMLDQPTSSAMPHNTDDIDDDAGALTAVMDDDDMCLDDGNVMFLAPASSASFAQLYNEMPDATIVGGATDVGLWVTKQHRPLNRLIWTGRVAGFDQIEDSGTAWRILPAVTHQQFMINIADDLPECAELLRRFGALQVRSSGTVCGNIANASPIGDLPPVFLALGGQVELTKGTAVRCLDLAAFFIDYGRQDRQVGEFVSAVILPRAAAPNLRCYKLSKRFDQDISTVMLAANISLENGVITGAKIAFGGMAGIPKRASAVEAALVGKPVDQHVFKTAAAALPMDFTPLTDMRGTAEYRMLSAQNLIIKYGLELANGKNMRLAGAAITDSMGGW